MPALKDLHALRAGGHESIGEPMFDRLLFVYDFNLRHARHLVEGLTPEQCVAQPGGLVNHPTWTIGHLAVTSSVVLMELGVQPAFPPEWMERFFPGVPISSQADDYPPFADLMEQYESVHARLSEVVPTVTEEILSAEPQMDPVKRRFSAVGQFVAYAMTAHEGVHLGQIADVRRALGLVNTDL